MHEGSEPDDFWQALGGLSRRARPVSQPSDQGTSTALDAPLALPPPPRLFLWPLAAPRPDAPAAAGAAAASGLVGVRVRVRVKVRVRTSSPNSNPNRNPNPNQADFEVFGFSQASLEHDATFLLDAGSANPSPSPNPNRYPNPNPNRYPNPNPTLLLDAGSAVFAWVGAAASPPAHGPGWLGQAASAYARARSAVDGRDARGAVCT